MNRKNIRLTAIIIAKNEEARIGKCIASLSVADEVLVVDSSSTDGTAALAGKLGARVIRGTSGDFSVLRNEAAKESGGEWLLYIDADETLNPELSEAIGNALDTAGVNGYELRRINYYLGQRWPGDEWMVRLIRKSALAKWQGVIHETPVIAGSTGRIADGALVHDTHRTLAEMVEKTNEWSESEAELRLRAAHPRIVPWRILRVMVTGFWDSYAGKGGWKAGTLGIIESTYQAFSMFVTYAKLWERQQRAGKRHTQS